MNESLSSTLKERRLSGMAETVEIRLHEAQGNHLTHSEFLELILQDELLVRQERKIAKRLPALREYEYTRHGTLCLFGNFHVATGRVLCPMIRQTRTEIDYLENLDNLILQDPNASYRIIADNLTTHCSESLVRYVAETCEIDEPLGKKGVRGILRSVKTRVEFLTDPSHRIQFLFTPRHCSWLNQIEIWFGTLRSKVTRWMSCNSLDALEDAILTFIDYYNTTLAHPYNWTYTGRVLAD